MEQINRGEYQDSGMGVQAFRDIGSMWSAFFI